MDNKALWCKARDELTTALISLGYPQELGNIIAKEIGSPKGIERMISYLYNVRPDRFELIADEMIAIKSDIDRWREKKLSEKANAAYNEMLYYGLENDEEDYIS